MAVRKYWRHMIGIEIALHFKNEPRDRKIAFLNHICETKTDGDVKKLVDSRSKLLSAYEQFNN